MTGVLFPVQDFVSDVPERTGPEPVGQVQLGMVRGGKYDASSVFQFIRKEIHRVLE